MLPYIAGLVRDVPLPMPTECNFGRTAGLLPSMHVLRGDAEPRRECLLVSINFLCREHAETAVPLETS